MIYGNDKRVEVTLNYNPIWRRVTGRTISEKKNNRGRWVNEKTFMYNFVSAKGYNENCANPKTKADAKSDSRDANQSVSVTFFFSPRRLLSGEPNDVVSVHKFKIGSTEITKVLYLDPCN